MTVETRRVYLIEGKPVEIAAGVHATLILVDRTVRVPEPSPRPPVDVAEIMVGFTPDLRDYTVQGAAFGDVRVHHQGAQIKRLPALTPVAEIIRECVRHHQEYAEAIAAAGVPNPYIVEGLGG